MAQLHVRDISEETHAALSAQAAAEGVSLAEWIRSTLDSRARTLSPAQLGALAEANRAAGRTMTWAEYDESMARIARRGGRNAAA